jgi:MOSC domain-containing protein YiiM
MPKISSIVYKPATLEKRPADYYSRMAVDRAELAVGNGIVGDTKGKSSNRQLNIMFGENVAELKQQGFLAEPGQLGEQIMIAGMREEAMSPGTQLRVGDSAVVELLEARTGCERFEHIQGHSAKIAAGRLGSMARVVADGPIAVGSTVEVVETS